MAKLTSAIDSASPEFRANQEAMAALVGDLLEKRAAIARGGPAKARERHQARSKLTARDRVNQLLDPGSPFLEIAPMAAFGMYEDQIHAAGLIAGIGRIMGRQCMILANDATIKGGTYYPMTVKKHLRAQEIARENRLTCIYRRFGRRKPAEPDRRLSRSRPFRPDLLQPGHHVGRGHRADRLRHGLLRRAAPMPAMSDESMIVRKQGTIFLGGPPLVKAATGEVVSAELGGADVHARESGVADHYALDDTHALAIVRDIVKSLDGRPASGVAVAEPQPPLYDTASSTASCR